MIRLTGFGRDVNLYTITAFYILYPYDIIIFTIFIAGRCSVNLTFYVTFHFNCSHFQSLIKHSSPLPYFIFPVFLFSVNVKILKKLHVPTVLKNIVNTNYLLALQVIISNESVLYNAEDSNLLIEKLVFHFFGK